MPLSPAEIEALVNAAQALPLKEALALLVLNKVGGFAAAGMGRLKKIIQDKQNEGKYAFVPNKEEARKLQQFSEEPNYKLVETLVPNYRYIDILRTGLLINFYHERNAVGDADRVKVIKMKICTRPNGTKLLKIANFPTTPFFTTVLIVSDISLGTFI